MRNVRRMQPDRQWWRDAVVYQIYPRSFQDSDGDGIGDLAGIASRLDHLSWLGVDALWLSPIYPSPQADSGYDVADYVSVDPVYGSLDDLDRLIAAAHERDIRVLMDLVVSHTSIEHPWFREHPDWYVWADEPANNWRGAFGGSAWSRDPASGRYYLHSFYPEQADLDWRNPEVRAAIADVIGFWTARGVDGFRVDAVTQLMKDPELRDEPPALGPPPLPLHPELAALGEVHARNHPEITLGAGGVARGGRRRAAGRRGLPARGAAGALPRLLRPRLLVRVPALALGRGRARERRSPARRRSSASPGCSPTTTSPASPVAVGRKPGRSRRCCR